MHRLIGKRDGHKGKLLLVARDRMIRFILGNRAELAQEADSLMQLSKYLRGELSSPRWQDYHDIA